MLLAIVQGANGIACRSNDDTMVSHVPSIIDNIGNTDMNTDTEHGMWKNEDMDMGRTRKELKYKYILFYC